MSPVPKDVGFLLFQLKSIEDRMAVVIEQHIDAKNMNTSER